MSYMLYFSGSFSHSHVTLKRQCKVVYLKHMGKKIWETFTKKKCLTVNFNQSFGCKASICRERKSSKAKKRSPINEKANLYNITDFVCWNKFSNLFQFNKIIVYLESSSWSSRTSPVTFSAYGLRCFAWGQKWISVSK